MKTNEEYKNDALASLSGNWTPAVLASIVYMLVLVVVSGSSRGTSMVTHNVGAIVGSSSFSLLLAILIGEPLRLGYDLSFLRLLDSRDNNILSNLTGYATTNYTKKVLTLLLKSIYVFLWSLLLVIPGIIKAFSYALVPYIISENPNLSPEEAISQSSKMMEGHRLDLFILYLSFIGWFILAVLTAGIGFLWLCPYISAAKASFYLDIKNEYNLAHPQVIISE